MKRALLALLLLPSCVIYTKDGADSGLDEPDAPGDGGGSDPGPTPDTDAPDTGGGDGAAGGAGVVYGSGKISTLASDSG